MQTRGKTAQTRGAAICCDLESENRIPLVANTDSPVSSQTTISSFSIDGTKVGQLAWVQCENEACLKWRQITQTEAEKLQITDKPWFCSMNTNSQFNSCDCPEEKLLDDKTASKCGYRIVRATLPAGSLVWARMPGHIKWPAILSPWDGQHVELDFLGDPKFYHVEFLGKPHTQYWVHGRSVEIYAESQKPILQQQQKTGKRKKKPLTNNVRHASVKYQRYLLESMAEADILKNLTCEERLAKCVFKYEKPASSEPSESRSEPQPAEVNKQHGKDAHSGLKTSVAQPSQQESSGFSLHVPTSRQLNDPIHLEPVVKKKRGRPPKSATLYTHGIDTSNMTGQDMSRQLLLNKTRYSHKDHCKKKKLKKQKKKKKKHKHKKKNHRHEWDPYEWHDDHNSWRPLYAAAPLATPPRRSNMNMQFGPHEFSNPQQPLQQTPLISKEDRLQADIQNLRRDEQEFHTSLNAFHKKTGRKTRKPPHWQGRLISLYQLFMAVQERGGFYKVCAVPGAWKNIYQDVSNVVLQQAGPFGHTAKKYYQRTLLQYELSCIKGKQIRPGKVLHHTELDKVQKQLNFSPPPPPSSYPKPIPSHNSASFSMNQTSTNFLSQLAALGSASPARLKTASCAFAEKGSTVSKDVTAPSTGQDTGKVDILDFMAADMTDMLDEETDQTVEEIQLIKSMLQAVNGDDDDVPVLDRPTHTDITFTKPSPLSSKKPFQFYSMQFDDADTVTKDPLKKKTTSYPDDTQIVPNVFIPSPEVQYPSGPTSVFTHETKEDDQTSKETDDMDQLVEDIDLLDQELSQQWLDI
ncbi:uncharacterized protein [Amphiura filiformis]|uniref:uncharacterized protein n=1 Tax=Amphiura filiformis TaxID=82378 RepID=UPI003B216EB5